MNSARRAQWLALCVGICALVQWVGAAELMAAKTATAKVMAKFPQGSPVIASGFVYGDSSHLVTCLHVVAGANQVDVVVGNLACAAKVVRVWRDADLVLLKMDRAADGRALTKAANLPEGGTKLIALGFPLGSPVVRSTTGELRQVGGHTLSDLIGNADLRREIQRNGFPSLQAPVLDMQLPITPGMSGGPVVDERGALVGICNGGLENGAGELTWAIEGSRLDQLMESTDTNAGNARGAARTLFAAETQAASGQTMTVAGRNFTKLRTRTLPEFTRFTEDPWSLNQLAGQFIQFQPFGWRFDVYREFESGATLVFPEGLSPVDDGDTSVVSTSRGSVEMRIRYQIDLPVYQQQLQASIAFEESIRVLHDDVYWVANPQWSYAQPLNFPNGLIVQRKSAVGMNLNYQTQMPQKYVFETFAVLQGKLLCVAAVNASYPQVFQDPSLGTAWGKMVLAVQLASFTQMNQ